MKKLIYVSLAVLAFAACEKADDKNGNEVLATGLTLSETSKVIEVYDQFELGWEVTPSNAAGEVSWDISDPDVVDFENGILVAKKTGQATITATWISSKWTGVEATCKVEVKDPTYTLARMKLNDSDKPVFNPLPSTRRTMFESHYILLYDHNAKDFVKGIDKTASEAEFLEGGECFAAVKYDWGKFQYNGALVVPQKPCKRAKLRLKFVSPNLSAPVEKIFYFKTDFNDFIYFGAPGSTYAYKSVIDLANNNAVKFIPMKLNSSGTALECVYDSDKSHFILTNNDPDKVTATLETAKNGDSEYCYVAVKRTSKLSTDESKSVDIQYKGEMQSRKYSFRFKTSNVNYYYF